MKNLILWLLAAIFLLGTGLIARSQNSVLSEGSWYKISVEETGIYKISYDNLVVWGIEPTQINPQHIRLFGNGNGMLPESNETFRYDDLQENVIMVYGEEDGNFDPGDYFLFYGEGPTLWNRHPDTVLFEHETNLYTERTCYFLNFDLGEGKRIETQYSTIIPPNHFVTSFNDYFYHELELENLIHSGKSWFGECFDEVLNYNFQVEFPNLISDDSLTLTVQAAGRSGVISNLEVNINSAINFQVDLPASNLSVNSDYAKIGNSTMHFLTNNELLNIDVTYQKPDEYSKAWLDYFEINASRKLKFDAGQICFRNLESAGMGNVSKFTIETSNSNINVWNVSDPVNVMSVDININSTTVDFILETDSLLEFIVFDEGLSLTPEYLGEIENQNLHGFEGVEMIIITHNNFKTQAQQLADFRETFNGITTFVTTPELIYNEFSSGVLDISAIRDFMKYLYEKSNGERPEYLLLFGDATYDYKNITKNNINYVPVWESLESLNRIMSYSTDDYFSEFDDVDKTSLLKIGIGRLPVKTVSEASAVVEKIIHYSSSEYAMGNWRNDIMTIADDEDGNLHLEQADEITKLIDTLRPSVNISKVYLDAFIQDSFPNGNPAYTEVNQAITDKINSGVSMISYTGHGFYGGLARERVLTELDIENWTNTDYYPFFFSASCDFGWFDDPDKYSFTEKAILLEGKGMSGIIGATRPTYAGSNKTFHENFMKVILTYPDFPVGKSLKHAKLLTGWSNNIRKYCLFGDPSMRLAIPLNHVVTEAINGVYAEDFNDTIHPAEQIVVSGFISDNEGNPIYNFHGNLKVKVYDIIHIDSTLGNDYSSHVIGFEKQDSVVYELETEVINGQFVFSFNYPNFSYEEFGQIKLSYYANDDLVDASGAFSRITVGGQMNATQDYQKESGFIQFYPTIVSDMINFKIESELSNLKIEIYNLQGVCVKQIFLNEYQKSSEGNFDISKLTDGMYIIQAVSASGIKSFKILKQ